MAEQKETTRPKDINSLYLQKVIGKDSLFEIAEKTYIEARRKKAFEEYWQEQFDNLPKQITNLFNELVRKRSDLIVLEGKVSAYRNITDLQFLLYFLQDILSSGQEGIKINPYDDPFLNQSLNQYAYESESFEVSEDEDWFFEDDGTEDDQWGEAPSITFEGFQRLIDINTSNIFENKPYISRRWSKLRKEILDLFDGYEKYQEFSKRKKTTTSFEEHLKEILSKRSKKEYSLQLGIQNKLLSFIDEFEIVFDELSNDNLMERFMGEELAIEIRNQYQESNRIVNLKSEIFKLVTEIDELIEIKIPEKISLHIFFLTDHAPPEFDEEGGISLILLQLEPFFESLKEVEEKGKLKRIQADSQENALSSSIEKTYIALFANETDLNDEAPDNLCINVSERIAYYLQSEEADTDKIELTLTEKETLYPIKSLSSSHPIGPIGLTHSGGGRRAEIFNLGIQQELAKLGALPWFDYLTTVSGGGWIGVNMISLLSGKPKNGDYFFNTQWDKYPFNPGKKIFELPPKPVPAPDPDTLWMNEAVTEKPGQNAQLKYLRDKGNYLAPRQGWINRDALRVLGWIVSSLTLNIFMFVLMLLTISSGHYLLSSALAPDIGGESYLIAANCLPAETCFAPDKLAEFIFNWGKIEVRLTYALSALISIVSSLVLIRTIKYSYEKFGKNLKMVAEKIKRIYKIRFLVFSLLAILTVGYLAFTPDSIQNFWIYPIFFISMFLISLIRNKVWNAPPENGRSSEEDLDTYLIENLALFSLGFPIFLIALMKSYLNWKGLLAPDTPQIFWILMPLVISISAGLGLRFYLMMHKKKAFGESRFRTIFWAYLGYHNIYLIVLLIFTAISVTMFFSQPTSEGSLFKISLSTALISAAWTGIMVYTKDKEKMVSLTTTLKSAINFSTGLRNYLLGLLVILLNISLIFVIESLINLYIPNPFIVMAVCLLSFIFLLVMGRLVNFNEMSLHYFWRDRTEEAFLKTDLVTEDGVVNPVRDDRNLLIGTHINEEGCSAPYHIITAAINLQGSWRLDVKDRKSRHFIFSRYYTGSDITGYVKTSQYRKAQIKDPTGKKVYMGMTKYSKAMAISAAAFASAIGEQSFFAEGFALTLFNIRLGWWLLNPKLYDDDPEFNLTSKFPRTKKLFRNPALAETKYLSKLEDQASWAPYLFDEALSLASERRELVNVSDGGHTGDNPGVYPLLQRRCKVIVVGDASYDPTAECEQFMNALLYAKVDMGIQVDIDLTGLYPATGDDGAQKEGMSKNHCAVGRITYPAFENYPEEKGWIIYLKTTITPDDPSQLLQYWLGHKEMFPQPYTFDQFFEEDQYEAQRLLGEVSARQPLEKLEKYYQAQIKEIKDTTEKGRAIFKLGLVQHVLKRNPDFIELKKNFNEMMADLQKALM